DLPLRPAPPRQNEESQPLGGRAVVGGIQDLAIDLVAQGLHSGDPGAENLALVTGDRPALLVERSPIPELADVLDQDPPRPADTGPIQDVPGRGPPLVVD